MDLGNPWALASGLLIGAVGMAMFAYGKREQNLRVLGGGLALCILPAFIASTLALWLLTGAVVGGVWWTGRGE
jgi:hypothetical protein